MHLHAYQPKNGTRQSGAKPKNVAPEECELYS